MQIYYLPLPEEEILTAFQGSTLVPPLGEDTTIPTVISITVTQTDTIISTTSGRTISSRTSTIPMISTAPPILVASRSGAMATPATVGHREYQPI